jgi:hypothetical protein
MREGLSSSGALPPEIDKVRVAQKFVESYWLYPEVCLTIPAGDSPGFPGHAALTKDG